MFVNHSTTEEPYEVKVSRTVLKTSRRGDLAAEFNVVAFWVLRLTLRLVGCCAFIRFNLYDDSTIQALPRQGGHSEAPLAKQNGG